MKINLFFSTALLISNVMFTYCNAQVNANPGNYPGKSETVSAGQAKLIKTLGTNEYANIYCGLTDKAGNLWFGTSGEGIYRYDGKLFTQFTVKDGLSNNIVLSVTEDKAGNIWFGTADGACFFDGKNFNAIPITTITGSKSYRKTMVDEYGLPYPEENAVWSIMQDKNGKFWFGTRDGVYCYDGKLFTRFLDDENIINRDSLQLKMVDCMMEDKKGNIWFCSGMMPGDEGVCCYNGKSITQFKPNGDGWIRNIIEDKEGNIYIATRHNGVCRFDSISGTFINVTGKAGIDNGSVSTVFEDKTGNIWIATELGSGQLGEDGGVWRFDGKTFTEFTTKDGLIHNGVFTIVEDKSGNIWFGTRNIGLCRYDGKTFTGFSE